MSIRSAHPGAWGLLFLAGWLAGCVAPAPAPTAAPIEVTVVVRGGGSCCGACTLVECHDRTAEIKAAYADPDKLHHTVPALGYSDHDRPRTVEHDRPRTVEHDRPRTVEHDRPRTVEHDLRDTVAHDQLRCQYRNTQLHAALQGCHQELNECRAKAAGLRTDSERENAGGACRQQYLICYHAVLDAPLAD